MGTTKKKYFESKIISNSDIFKAIGHPARLQVLTILLEKKHCCCGEIVSQLPLSQSTVSKHLIELKKVNIIGELLDGKKTIFYLKKESLNSANDYLTNFIFNCKKEEVFNSHKKIVIKRKQNNFIIDPNQVSGIKDQKRKANIGLKKHNYIFTHLKEKSSI